MHFNRISANAVFVAGCLMAGWHVPGLAVDSASLEFGTGNKTKMVRVGAQWDWDKKWFQSNGWHLGGYWDATAAMWRQNRYQNIPGNQKDLYDIGITPVFRYQRDSKLGLYGEAAIGAHLLSDIYDNNDRQFSTRFEFGDHIGIGYVFDNKLDLSLKFQHFSNGSIKQPNDGANLTFIRAAYRF